MYSFALLWNIHHVYGCNIMRCIRVLFLRIFIFFSAAIFLLIYSSCSFGQSNKLKARLMCYFYNGRSSVVQIFERSIVVSEKDSHSHFEIKYVNDDYFWGLLTQNSNISIRISRYSGDITIMALSQPVEWQFSCPENLPNCKDFALPEAKVEGACAPANRMF